MQRLKSRIAIMLGMTILATGLAAAVASPAHAATYCEPYTNHQYWSTSTQWGRVSVRVCLEVGVVSARARVQWRIDWPSNCNLSIGLPPSVSGSCPTSRLGKRKTLNFEGLKIGAKLRLPTGYTVSKTCTWGSFFSHVAHYHYPGEPAQNTTKTCVGPWQSKGYSGAYRVTAFNVSGDVDNDGDGWKVIFGVTSRSGSFVGPF